MFYWTLLLSLLLYCYYHFSFYSFCLKLDISTPSVFPKSNFLPLLCMWREGMEGTQGSNIFTNILQKNNLMLMTTLWKILQRHESHSIPKMPNSAKLVQTCTPLHNNHQAKIYSCTQIWCLKSHQDFVNNKNFTFFLWIKLNKMLLSWPNLKFCWNFTTSWIPQQPQNINFSPLHE